MRVGVGVTTYLRPETLELWKVMVFKFLPKNAEWYVYDDAIERKGVAYGKNMCLYNLRHCDYIFLFDDDCFPIKEGWTEPFINSGFDHLLYMNDTYEKILSYPNYSSYLHASGVFMFLTKKVIQKVGYYCPEYGIYGLEHAGYSQRIYRANLSPCFFPVLTDTDKYIYSLDHQGVGGFNIEHKGSLTKEERDILTPINDIIYHKECKSEKNYYNFKP